MPKKRTYTHHTDQEQLDLLLARIDRLEKAAGKRVDLIHELRNKAQTLQNRINNVPVTPPPEEPKIG